MEAEERFHCEYWTTWLARAAEAGGGALERVRSAWSALRPLVTALFDFRDEAAAEPVDGGTEALDEWKTAFIESVDAEADRLGLAPGAPEPGPPEASHRERMIDELTSVYREAPDGW